MRIEVWGLTIAFQGATFFGESDLMSHNTLNLLSTFVLVLSKHGFGWRKFQYTNGYVVDLDGVRRRVCLLEETAHLFPHGPVAIHYLDPRHEGKERIHASKKATEAFEMHLEEECSRLFGVLPPMHADDWHARPITPSMWPTPWGGPALYIVDTYHVDRPSVARPTAVALCLEWQVFRVRRQLSPYRVASSLRRCFMSPRDEQVYSDVRRDFLEGNCDLSKWVVTDVFRGDVESRDGQIKLVNLERMYGEPSIGEKMTSLEKDAIKTIREMADAVKRDRSLPSAPPGIGGRRPSIRKDHTSMFPTDLPRIIGPYSWEGE